MEIDRHRLLWNSCAPSNAETDVAAPLFATLAPTLEPADASE